MGLTDLKKELKILDKDQLVALIADLYKKNKAAQEYLDFYVQPNERERFEKYRTKVVEAFFPQARVSAPAARGQKGHQRLSEAGAGGGAAGRPAARVCGDGRAVYQ